jgi:hypothetical protein
MSASWTAQPPSDKAVLAAHEWGLKVEAAISGGYAAPAPGVPRGLDPEDFLRAIAGFFNVSDSIEDPNEILSAAVVNIGAPMLEAYDERVMQADIADMKARYAVPPKQGLAALTTEQELSLLQAVAGHVIPEDLLADPSLSQETRDAVVNSIDPAIWEEAVVYEQKYGPREEAEAYDENGDPVAAGVTSDVTGETGEGDVE